MRHFLNDGREQGSLDRFLQFGTRERSIPLLNTTVSAAGVCVLGIEMILAAVWAKSAMHHLANPYYLLSAIYQYPFATARLGLYVATALPYLQCVMAVSLISRVSVSGSMLISSLLLLAMALAEYSVISRGLRIRSAWFWSGDQNLVGWHSMTMTVLLALSAMAVYLYRLRCPATAKKV